MADSVDDEEVKLLLIEDDGAAAEMYRMRLEQDGYTVVVAGDGESGLDVARRWHPDLIYLDLRLPRMDGFDVLRSLRSNAATAGIPVVILTNLSGSELR